jgi:hypothetical protein
MPAVPSSNSRNSALSVMTKPAKSLNASLSVSAIAAKGSSVASSV